MPAYFARCLRGLEDFCAVELSAIAGLNLRERKIRTLFFEFSGPPQRLGEVRSLDDIFIHLGSHTGINHTRAMLSKIPELLPPMFKKLDEEIEIIQRYRELSTNPSFSLTIGLQGRKNFSRFELQNNLLPLFQKHLTGTYIPNEKGSKGAELDFRISLEGDQLDLGLRLGEKPFHRRTYKLQSRPGSTKAPLAYIMASLASIEADHLVLDPCCGVGTILIEASLAFPSARYLGIDIKEEALQSAEVNRKEAGCEIDFKLGDARRLRLMDASVDRIVS
ncbi:MAG: methyltransferase domain-containing protein, partial [Bacteroidota bacterium]